MVVRTRSEKVRQAVRGLLVTQDLASILLLKVRSPVNGRNIWMTPGGGIENGETDVQALKREIWEETGLQISQAGQFVFTRTFSFETGTGRFTQFEKYFLVIIDKFTPTMNNNPATIERSIFQEFRWWTIDGLTSASSPNEQFAPSCLGTQLNKLLQNLAIDKAVFPIDLSSS